MLMFISCLGFCHFYVYLIPICTFILSPRLYSSHSYVYAISIPMFILFPSFILSHPYIYPVLMFISSLSPFYVHLFFLSMYNRQQFLTTMKKDSCLNTTRSQIYIFASYIRIVLLKMILCTLKYKSKQYL